MKVVLDGQWICHPQARGIIGYAVNLTHALLKRARNEYHLTYFDGNKERDNGSVVRKAYGKYAAELHEYDSFAYKNAWTDVAGFRETDYKSLINIDCDLYHFFHIIPLPRTDIGRAVVMVHDLLPILFPQYYDVPVFNQIKDAIEYIERNENIFIVTNSVYTKNDIIEHTGISGKRIFPTLLGYDEKICYPDESKPTEIAGNAMSGKPYFLYVGGIDQRKNITGILDAFSVINKKYPDTELLLAGCTDNNGNDLEVRIDEMARSGNVKKLGFVSDDERRVLYSHATAFLFPSHYEGFGLPVLEAMACGCSVITSNVSSLPEVAGDAGILIDPKNTEQLIFEMERVLLSPSLQSDLRQKGLERAKLFSWDRTAEMTEQVYEKVMKEF
jgi:glycosyltransferase involved in cell wall biosynthesis